MQIFGKQLIHAFSHQGKWLSPLNWFILISVSYSVEHPPWKQRSCTVTASSRQWTWRSWRAERGTRSQGQMLGDRRREKNLQCMPPTMTIPLDRDLSPWGEGTWSCIKIMCIINCFLIRHLDLPGRQMEALSQEQLELARRQIDLANAGRPPLFGLGGQKYFWYGMALNNAY